MTAGHIGNGHAGLGRFGQDGHLLIERIPTPALNAGQDFDSFRIVGHRRMTRRKPSPSLRSYVRFKWGPLQDPLNYRKLTVTRMSDNQHQIY